MHYQIGDFSKISKISPRMLRYLDKEGLLKPSEVLENGYRSYNDKDLYRAAEITRLKRYRFTYSEIKTIMAQGLAQDKKILKKQLSKLKCEVEDTDVLVNELACELKREPMHYCNLYEISVGKCKEKWQLIQEKTLKTSELDTYLEQMTQLAIQLEVQLAGLYSLSFLQSAQQQFQVEDFGDEETLIFIRWQQPIQSPVQLESFTCKLQAEWIILSTKHYGPYESIFVAYQALFTYAELEGFIIVSDFEEIYLLDASHTNNPNAYLTEVQVVVEKKA